MNSTNPSVFSESVINAQEKYKLATASIEFEAKVKITNVPTNDTDVRLHLRLCGEPICLFGEGPAERRERLKRIYAKRDITPEVIKELRDNCGLFEVKEKDEKREITEEFYTPASSELIKKRDTIATSSFHKSMDRLSYYKHLETDMSFFASYEQSVAKEWRQNQSIEVMGSHLGSNRPLDCARLSPTGHSVLLGSWGGEISIWNTDKQEEINTFVGHEDRICSVSWNPQYTEDTNSSSLAFASASFDKSIKLWSSISPEPLGILTGHINRVSKVVFHPFLPLLLSASYDTSIRMWDIETQKEILLQDGHAKELSSMAIHPDGSLLFTGDKSGIGRLWDLRSAQKVLTIQSHIKGILDADFNSNGYTFCTGSEDNTAKIWDMRKTKCIYTIPAHTNLLTRTVYSDNGEFIYTASFDKTIKIWSARDYSCLKILKGHDTRITDMDVYTKNNSINIISASSDKIWKIWCVSDL